MSVPSIRMGRLVRHSTIYAISNVVRQMVGFLMLPIYTQYLSPADYGVVALLTLALAISEPFFGARLGEAMPKFYYDELAGQTKREGAVVSTALIITGAVSSFFSLVIFGARDSASELLFGSSALGLAVGVFAFQLLTQAVEYYGLTFVRIQQRPLLYLTLSLSKLSIQLILNAYLVIHLEMGVMGVVYSSFVTSTLFAVGLAAFVLSSTGITFDRSIAGKMLAFSWPLWFAGLASLYIFQSNLIFIRVFDSLEAVGLYELAARFGWIVMLLVWQPFYQFWEAERFRIYQEAEAQRSGFQTVFLAVSIVLIVAGLGVSIFSGPVIELMSSEPFHDAARIVPLIVLANLFVCGVWFCNFSFLVEGQTGVVSKTSYMTAVIVTIGNLLLIPAFGALGAAGAQAIAFLCQLLLTAWLTRRYFDMGLDLRGSGWLLIVAIITFVLSSEVFVVGRFWWDLAIKAAIYTTFLVLSAAWALRDPIVRMEVFERIRKLPRPIDSRS